MDKTPRPRRLAPVATIFWFAISVFAVPAPPCALPVSSMLTFWPRLFAGQEDGDAVRLHAC
ncbi:hypothetical protein [Roseateles sp.]|uniref:hypothetical protein n=1 Tax=Roseateles sp. TaxID=1971397 RepID=UPI0032665806